MPTKNRQISRAARITGIGLIVLHVGALAAFLPQMFSWTAVGIGFLFYYLTIALGVGLGYHRLLTHRSLRTPKAIEYGLAILGALSLQGGPLDWVGTHRAHHAHTDADGDPHDANRGMFWSHVEWLYRYNAAKPVGAALERLVPDLSDNRFYAFLEKTYVWWTVALALIFFAIGGLPWVVWGIFVRIVVTYHITWLVNSAAHEVGYQTYRTGDKSTNNWWVAILTWGEGWHNNHHAFPASARHGLRWYELDATWITIKVMKALKLAHDIKLPTPGMIARMAIAPRTPRRT